ncbi:hypothetical protein GHT07_06800 [Caenimonas koreensis DSM 17982]|uniref:Uncharacterized protein n=1 Tax=Caenimonas koreensis DSM 17982 TaxID=1121255 RepID=A0A844B5P9_9BURK|nr:hypothetical protein [Caenimonas koreensis]MRD46979.1 hypothetical protein [Caenimonas koreensis DSM 17982]
MKTDEICERYSEKSVGLVVRLLDDDNQSPSTVLIEGSVDALRMLAELLVAVADESDNDGFFISPFGAGKVHFGKASELGVYIHRT